MPRLGMKRIIIFLLVGGLAAGSVVIIRSLTFPISIAVPPLSDTMSRMLQAIGREVHQTSHWVTLNRIAFPSYEAAAKALQDGDVNLAILRTDAGLPNNAQTIAILRTLRVFLIVAPHSPIEGFSDLRNKTIGILPGPPQDEALLDKILAYNNIPPTSVTRIRYTPAEASTALGQKKIAAIYIVGVPGVGASSEAFSAAVKATKGTPVVLGVDEAEAMTKRFGALEKADIDEGSFGGAKAQPEEDTTTLAVTLRLMAKSRMPSYMASELASKLFEAKARLVTSEPSVTGIEAPDTDDRRFAVHPGAKSFFDGDAPTFFDRFESLFWIGSALLGVLGSAATWLLSQFGKKQTTEDLVGGRLAAFLKNVRQADKAGLEKLEDELDSIVLFIIEARAQGEIDSDDINTYAIAMFHARAGIEERHAALQQARSPNAQDQAIPTSLAPDDQNL